MLEQLNPWRLLLSLSVLCALPTVGCEQQGFEVPLEIDHESVVGEMPDAVSDVIAGAVCTRRATCGDFSVVCASSPDGEPSPGCEVEREAVDYDACVDEMQPQILADLECAVLTDEEAALVDACVLAMADEPCPSTDDVQSSTGAESDAGSEPWMPPSACDEVAEIFARCDDDFAG